MTTPATETREAVAVIIAKHLMSASSLFGIGYQIADAMLAPDAPLAALQASAARTEEAERERDEARAERDNLGCSLRREATYRGIAEQQAEAGEAELATAQSAARAATEQVERALAILDDAIRPSVIKLMAGEMTAQEARTAYAVANGIAAKVRAALLTQEPPHAE